MLKDSYTAIDFDRLVTDETDHLELKSGMGQNPVQEAMVAFSNSDGGVILCGVAPDGSIPNGRRLDQSAEDRVHDAAMSARDIGRYSMQEIAVAGKTVVAIHVEKRVEGFAQTSSGRVLVRRGAHNIALFGSDLIKLVNERSLHRFELTDTGRPLSSADPEYLAQVCSVFELDAKSPEINERLRERGLVTNADTLTVAGALLLTDPSVSLDQQKASVEVRRYPEGSEIFDRREEFVGPIQKQVADATAFIMDELGQDVVITGLYRHELPRLPEVVIREALANGVAHRSYEAQGTAVLVELRPEAVIVVSPGGLPEPVTVANLRQAQAARNQAVIHALRRFRLAEDAGRGVDVMQDSMEEALLDPPTFEDLGASVRVVLPLHGPTTPAERAWVSDLERRGEIEPLDRLLLVHAARGETLTNARAREILNVSHFDAREALQRLRDAQLLKQEGDRGGARYLLVDEVAPPAAFRLRPDEVDDLIVRAAADGPISNETVRNLTGLNRAAALNVLKRLVQERRLVRRGSRRGTSYAARGV